MTAASGVLARPPFLQALRSDSDAAALQIIATVASGARGQRWECVDSGCYWRNWALLQAVESLRPAVAARLYEVGAKLDHPGAVLRGVVERERAPALPTLRVLLQREQDCSALQSALWTALVRDRPDAALALLQTGAFPRGYKARLVADLAVRADHVGLAEHCLRDRSLPSLRRATHGREGQGLAVRALLAAYHARQTVERTLRANTAVATP